MLLLVRSSHRFHPLSEGEITQGCDLLVVIHDVFGIFGDRRPGSVQ